MIGCIVMASGLSRRYGKNKLLEPVDGREVLLRTVDSLMAAGLEPLVVTRSTEVEALMAQNGIGCIRHDGPKKCDTMRAGIAHFSPDAEGYLFMPADQPLVRPGSLRRLVAQFLHDPVCAVRLGFGDDVGSPVLFPAACRDDLLAYDGDRGGMEVLRKKGIPCDIVQADDVWELWDVDTPEDMVRVREALDNQDITNRSELCFREV